MPTPAAVPLTDSQRHQLVKARGDMSQAELARRIGITSQAVNRIERGNADPSFTTLRKLAGVLGLQVEVRLSKRTF